MSPIEQIPVVTGSERTVTVPSFHSITKRMRNVVAVGVMATLGAAACGDNPSSQPGTVTMESQASSNGNALKSESEDQRPESPEEAQTGEISAYGVERTGEKTAETASADAGAPAEELEVETVVDAGTAKEESSTFYFQIMDPESDAGFADTFEIRMCRTFVDNKLFDIAFDVDAPEGVKAFVEPSSVDPYFGGTIELHVEGPDGTVQAITVTGTGVGTGIEYTDTIEVEF